MPASNPMTTTSSPVASAPSTAESICARSSRPAGTGRRDGRADAHQRRRHECRLSRASIGCQRGRPNWSWPSGSPTPPTPSRFRISDEDLTTVHKADGTPVSQVDFDIEQAMLDVLRAERPADAVIGEEVGSQPGTRRDGGSSTASTARTTTPSGGRMGDGDRPRGRRRDRGRRRVGPRSAVAGGRSRGGGAWQAPTGDDGAFDAAAAEPMPRGTATSLASAA